jgi:hypothetical protein
MMTDELSERLDVKTLRATSPNDALRLMRVWGCKDRTACLDELLRDGETTWVSGDKDRGPIFVVKLRIPEVPRVITRG